MKEITYPTDIKVYVDQERGEKLDAACKENLRSRPGTILQALDFYFKDLEEKNAGDTVS
jgi:hypothetical protein